MWMLLIGGKDVAWGTKYEDMRGLERVTRKDHFPLAAVNNEGL